MTSPTTIKRLRELLEKATPGEWIVERAPATNNWPGKLYVSTGTHTNDVEICSLNHDEDDNATLIVEMRNALPALLDRVEAMEKALKPFEASTLVGQSALIVAGDAITQAFDSGKKYVTIIMESDAAEAFNAVRLVSEQSQ